MSYEMIKVSINKQEHCGSLRAVFLLFLINAAF